MNNKGFTLVEIMAVIVIIVIISVIGYAGITAVQRNIKNNLWEGKIENIESGAILYGEDNKNRLTETCVVDGSTKTACVTVTVQYLLDKSYITTEEEDENGNEVIINDSLGDNVYANDMLVYIYLENNIVYAKLDLES